MPSLNNKGPNHYKRLSEGDIREIYAHSYMSIPQAAALLGTTRANIDYLLKEGKINYIVNNRKLYIEVKSFIKHAQEHKRQLLDRAERILLPII